MTFMFTIKSFEFSEKRKSCDNATVGADPRRQWHDQYQQWITQDADPNQQNPSSQNLNLQLKVRAWDDG